MPAVFELGLDQLSRFWRLGARLKEEQRRGWVQRLRIPRAESVADHSFGVALLALFEGERRGYNLERMLKLALIHDLEEAITGDLTPLDKKLLGVGRVGRDRQRAIEGVVARIPVGSRASYRRLWRDLELGRSREARIVRQLDRLEMAFQAHEYGKQVPARKLRDFYRSAQVEVTDPFLRRILSKMTGGV